MEQEVVIVLNVFNQPQVVHNVLIVIILPTTNNVFNNVLQILYKIIIYKDVCVLTINFMFNNI